MDIKKWFRKNVFDTFPLLVSGSPVKVIAIILVLTLVMGYFASFAEMDTDDETFEPDTETSDWRDDVEEKFGTAGDYSQVVFIGDLGDALTQDVLLDMLHTKEAVLEHEEINQTLRKDGGVPEGMMTLADLIIQANRTQQLSRTLEDIYDDLNELHISIRNQTEMYERLNISLSNNLILAQSSDEEIRTESAEAFKSMSYIIDNPDSWTILQEYMDMFERIIAPMDLAEYDGTENLSSELTQDEEDEIPEEGQYFIELFEASARILYEHDPTPAERRAVGRMLTYFLEISEHIAYIQPDFGFVEDIPSVEPSLDEKIAQVENMTDREIKSSLKEVHEYDPDPLRESIERSIEILDEAETEEVDAYDHLDATDNTLSELETIYEEEGWEEEMEPYVHNYSTTLDGYYDLLDGTMEVITGMSSTMRSAEFLPELIDDMARMTVNLSSEEFDGDDLTVRRIRASSGMGLVLMDDSIDSDIREEAQEDLIDLTDEVSENSDTKVYASQVMLQQINDSAMRSMYRLLPLAFAFVVVVLMLVYRSIIETVLSLLSLTIAIVWTFGAGVILGYKFNPLIVAVPILLTGLIIDYGLHMVMRYREEKAKDKKPSSATRLAIMTVGGALLLTTVTTAIGFLSNVFSDLLVIRQFGILAAIGISSSLILMVGFLPAILQIVEEWRGEDTEKTKKSETDEAGNEYIRKFLSISSIIADEKPWAMIIAALIITMAAGYGAANVDTTFNIEDFLPEGEPQSENIDYINANYNISTSTVYILVEGDVTEREFLYAVDHVEFNSLDNRYIMEEEGVDSPLSVLREYGTATVGQEHYNETIVDAFRESDTEGNGIPDRNIEELYDLLYEAPESRDSIRNVLYRGEDGDYQAAVLTFTENEELINRDLDNAAEMKEQLEDDSEPLRNVGYTTKVTSSNIISQETTEELTSTQIQSLTLTIIIVASLLTLIFYSSKKTKILGILSAFPVTLVTIWIIGTMYALDVPLNVLTVTITALTVGMGVDFSIHIAHRFIEEMEEGKDLFQASQETVLNTGSALFGSAATTVGAFGILSTSNIVPLAQFGYITAMAIAYSFIVAVFLLPSTMMIWAKFTGVQSRLVEESEKAERKKKAELPTLDRRDIDQGKRKERLPTLSSRKTERENPGTGRDTKRDDLPVLETRKTED